MLKKYRHLPTEIEAIQLTKESFNDCIAALSEKQITMSDATSEQECFIGIETDEGERAIRETDWIISGILGVWYPCSNKVFQESYEVQE